MSTIELEDKKDALVRDIINETNEEIVIKMMVYFRNTKEKSGQLPWQMTVDELRQEVRESEIEYEQGLSSAHEEFLKEQAVW